MFVLRYLDGSFIMLRLVWFCKDLRLTCTQHVTVHQTFNDRWVSASGWNTEGFGSVIRCDYKMETQRHIKHGKTAPQRTLIFANKDKRKLKGSRDPQHQGTNNPSSTFQTKLNTPPPPLPYTHPSIFEVN